MKKYIYIGVGVVIILAVVVYYAFASRTASYITAAVVSGSITQEASASGNVEAPTTIDLQFQNGGRLVALGVATGDHVSAGEVLARQDTSVLSAQLQQAEAAVATQQANLASLMQGTRPEQLAVTQAQVGATNRRSRRQTRASSMPSKTRTRSRTTRCTTRLTNFLPIRKRQTRKFRLHRATRSSYPTCSPTECRLVPCLPAGKRMLARSVPRQTSRRP